MIVGKLVKRVATGLAAGERNLKSTSMAAASGFAEVSTATGKTAWSTGVNIARRTTAAPSDSAFHRLVAGIKAEIEIKEAAGSPREPENARMPTVAQRAPGDTDRRRALSPCCNTAAGCRLVRQCAAEIAHFPPLRNERWPESECRSGISAAAQDRGGRPAGGRCTPSREYAVRGLKQLARRRVAPQPGRITRRRRARAGTGAPPAGASAARISAENSSRTLSFKFEIEAVRHVRIDARGGNNTASGSPRYQRRLRQSQHQRCQRFAGAGRFASTGSGQSASCCKSQPPGGWRSRLR